MYYGLNHAHREGVRGVEREIPHRPDARQRVQRHHRGRPAIEQAHRLADVQRACARPATISSELGMAGHGHSHDSLAVE